MSRKIHKPRPKQALSIPTILLVVGGVLLLVAAVFAWSRAKNSADLSKVEVEGQPKLTIDQEVIDYGEVKLGTPLTFQLTVTNVGDEVLRFTEEPFIEVAEGC